MLFVDNENVTDPRVNLAIEEHLLRNLQAEEDILLFYINEPSIIIGRNQNTLEEINRDYVEAHGIYVVRRLSGGGTVYHDLGNMNFSFIMRRGKENLIDFKKFTAPVVRALVEMGIPAELGGRNDIQVAGRKVSGNASYSVKAGMVCHGTLLFDTDLERLSQALNVKPGKIVSKGIKSVRSRVANLREFLAEPLDIQVFRARLLQSIFHGSAEIPQYCLGEADWQAIRQFSNDRYMRWEWNWGNSPEFNVQKTHRFALGEIDARIHVQNGRIGSIKFYGDFFGQEDVAGLEAALAGVRYERGDIAQTLSGTPVEAYFSGLTAEELADFLY
jgi:lipoate-protein ligase A